MVCLRYLYLEETRITKLPSPIGNLKGLACLEVGNCKYLNDIECFVDLQLPKRCVDLDCLHNCESLNYLESSSSNVVKGNIFEFIFTNCLRLHETNGILEYSLLKFQLYTERLHQLPNVPERACSFCLPRGVSLEWFSHQSWGSTVTCQLSSYGSNSKFLGFSLYAVIAFHSFSHSLQVKCTYHFSNEHGDSHDLYCYLHGWYNEKRIDSDHILVGFDPCLVAKEDDIFSEYSKVLVKFQLEDMNGNLLPLDLCQVHECGIRLLYEDGIHCIDYYCDYYCDTLEAMFQGKRARFQGSCWEDYIVMSVMFSKLANSLDFQLYLEELYRQEEPDVPVVPSSFWISGDTTPEWFSHQSLGSTVTFQLSSNWANSKFLGFSLCAVIAFGPARLSFGSVRHRLRVKCTYHFRNKHGDSRDLNCYLLGKSYENFCKKHSDSRDLNFNYNYWYLEKEQILLGFDPCLVAKEKDTFSEYSEVSVEFHLESNLFCFCHVIKCGVHLLYDSGAFGLCLLHASDEDKIRRFHLIMSDSSCLYPLDRDELEVRFQDKRARFQADRWEDYYVMRRTYEFLADLQVPARASSFCLRLPAVTARMQAQRARLQACRAPRRYV
uniref:C-JID domain-containing protein n=1 Tax=Populus alba TaxID=43335 RepID=A0A4U5NNR1_POPAL|nr:hypothetical protein D5086_0000257400 [Populus alba]